MNGHAGHTPDFLAVMGGGGYWLLDIRPVGLISEMDTVKFAASREAAAAYGWRYSVITGRHPHVLSGLDALSAQRQPLMDQLGCQPVWHRQLGFDLSRPLGDSSLVWPASWTECQ
ncbi:hypothetical protein ACH4L5_35130 [Streptomyces sp. NPDC017405]|uniref:hypothetical protein n=1 Tax=unclassified Streptomyces TaxID=2593676 RepID=UPI0037B15530